MWWKKTKKSGLEREGIVLKETNGRILSEGGEVETSIYKAIV